MDDPVPPSLAKNVPAAWKWYEEYSAKYRKAMSGGGGSHQSRDAIWRGLYGCVVYEDEWRKYPGFAEAAADATSTTVVTIKEPGRDTVRDCPYKTRTPHISLVPSEDQSKAMLELDRRDLHWATMTVPYVPEYHDKTTGQWLPEICIADEGCSGIRKMTPYWLYLPRHRALVRLEERRLEAFRFSHLALRHGDGL